MTDSFQCNQLQSLQHKLEKDEPVRITALGDSLTYGWEASFSYFDLFISKLRADFCGVEITGHNAGICGDTAPGAVKRVSQLLHEEPNLLLVQFAINDLNSGLPLEEYATAMGAIARKALRTKTIPLFITSGPLMYPKERTRIEPYYNKMRDVADSYDAPVADIATHWLAHCEEKGIDLSEHYFDDGVHPNDAGYHQMAASLYHIIKTL